MALATIAISSRNRANDLRRALQSACSQSVAVEVLVVDDASEDDTAEIVRSEFPTATLFRHQTPTGYIAARNELARRASTPFVFSIDDDAAFSSPRVVEQTLADFSDRRIGAVAIPFINVDTDNHIRQKSPDSLSTFVTDRFIGTAHALRRDVFVALGGYGEHFVHQGEEGDYCIRMMDAGYFVRLGNADPIHHFESPRRSYARMDYYGRRNDILFAWQNIPLPDLFVHLPATTLNGLRTAIRVGRYRQMLAGIAAGYASSAVRLKLRRPVSRSTFKLFRRLKRVGALTLGDVGIRSEPIDAPILASSTEFAA